MEIFSDPEKQKGDAPWLGGPTNDSSDHQEDPKYLYTPFVKNAERQEKWKRDLSAGRRSLVRYIQPSQSSLLRASLIVVSVSTIGATLFVFFLDSSTFGDQLQKYNFADAFLYFAYLLSPVYQKWFQGSISSIVDKPTMFGQLLLTIKSYGSSLAAYTKMSPEYCGLDTEAARAKDIELKLGTNDWLFHRLQLYHTAMNYYSIRLFSTYRDEVEFKNREELRKEINQYIENDMEEDPQLLLETLIMLSQKALLDLYNADGIDGISRKECMHQLGQVSVKIQEATNAYTGSTPKLFDTVTTFILAIFFLGIVPIQMYSSVGGWMIITYPTVAFSLTAYYIFSKTLGDPFNPNTYINSTDIVAWRSKAQVSVNTLQQASALRDLYLGGMDPEAIRKRKIDNVEIRTCSLNILPADAECCGGEKRE